MGSYLHRKEYLPNLKKISEMGVLEWVKYEEERWRCPQCDLPMSWYDTKCTRCGEPRSEVLFPLSENKKCTVNTELLYNGDRNFPASISYILITKKQVGLIIPFHVYSKIVIFISVKT